MKQNIHRRRFLFDTSAALALAAFKTSNLNFLSQTTPKRVALIGTGWYGKSDLFRLMQGGPVDVVALCDVDKQQLNKAADMVSQRQKNYKKLALYGDYRKLLAEQKPEIVLIGTPDHWHALTAIDAMRSGAHVYVQKPISVDVMEGE